MSLEKFTSDEGTGKIVSVQVGKRRMFIEEEHWPKWTKYDEEGKTPSLDQTVYCLTYTVDGDEWEHTELLTRPMSRKGYNLSSVKKVLEKNGLGYDPEQWAGSVVKISFSKEGYPSLAK